MACSCPFTSHPGHDRTHCHRAPRAAGCLARPRSGPAAAGEDVSAAAAAAEEVSAEPGCGEPRLLLLPSWRRGHAAVARRRPGHVGGQHPGAEQGQHQRLCRPHGQPRAAVQHQELCKGRGRGAAARPAWRGCAASGGQAAGCWWRGCWSAACARGGQQPRTANRVQAGRMWAARVHKHHHADLHMPLIGSGRQGSAARQCVLLRRRVLQVGHKRQGRRQLRAGRAQHARRVLHASVRRTATQVPCRRQCFGAAAGTACRRRLLGVACTDRGRCDLRRRRIDVVCGCIFYDCVLG